MWFVGALWITLAMMIIMMMMLLMMMMVMMMNMMMMMIIIFMIIVKMAMINGHNASDYCQGATGHYEDDGDGDDDDEDPDAKCNDKYDGDDFDYYECGEGVHGDDGNNEVDNHKDLRMRRMVVILFLGYNNFKHFHS